MAIFYEVATLTKAQPDGFYALIRVDTDSRVADAVEGTVLSVHQTYPEAEAAAIRARAGKPATAGEAR